jgi:hypothetical protein
MILHNCKYLFQPHNREFLQAALEGIHKSIQKLTHGDVIVRNLSIPDRQKLVLKRAFREGTLEDVRVLYSFLPELFRYSRAARTVEMQSQQPITVSTSNLPPRKKKKRYVEDHDMLPGAILISKLFYNEEELKKRNVEKIVENGMREIAEQFTGYLKKHIASRKYLELALSEDEKLAHLRNVSNIDRCRLRVLPVLRALNDVITEREALRTGYFGPENHLVDQLVQPDTDGAMGTRFTYAVLYASVINSVYQLNMKAVGIQFPSLGILTRLAVRGPHDYGSDLLFGEDLSTPPRSAAAAAPAAPAAQEGAGAGAGAGASSSDGSGGPLIATSAATQLNGDSKFGSRSSGGGGKKSSSYWPNEIAVAALQGHWVGLYSYGMYALEEVVVNFNQETMSLEARKFASTSKDGAEAASGPDFHSEKNVCWRMDFSDVFNSNSLFLTAGVEYEVSVPVSVPGSGVIQYAVYTLKLTEFPAKLFKKSYSIVTDAPHIEILMEPVLSRNGFARELGSSSGSSSNHAAHNEQKRQQQVLVTDARAIRSTIGVGQLLKDRPRINRRYDSQNHAENAQEQRIELHQTNLSDSAAATTVTTATTAAGAKAASGGGESILARHHPHPAVRSSSSASKGDNMPQSSSNSSSNSYSDKRKSNNGSRSTGNSNVVPEVGDMNSLKPNTGLSKSSSSNNSSSSHPGAYIVYPPSMPKFASTSRHSSLLSPSSSSSSFSSAEQKGMGGGMLEGGSGGMSPLSGGDLQGRVLPTIRFCRTVDLDRCLLQLTAKGIEVWTPCEYLSELTQ